MSIVPLLPCGATSSDAENYLSLCLQTFGSDLDLTCAHQTYVDRSGNLVTGFNAEVVNRDIEDSIQILTSHGTLKSVLSRLKNEHGCETPHIVEIRPCVP